jgi:hypothetical protein
LAYPEATKAEAVAYLDAKTNDQIVVQTIQGDPRYFFLCLSRRM